MLKVIGIAVVAIVVVILIHAASRPDIAHVERSIVIKAPPEKIFALIDDFRQWDQWTPYNKDPAMTKAYSASTRGVGARYAWEGNRSVGKGDITITESEPPARIAFNLHMIAPFEGNNHVVFALKAAGDSTTVDWILEDRPAYFVKVMGIFLDIDKMVGRDFETGLANLKAVAEKQ
jgi:uncharacterized protein YndB with AHSA1/START domain